VHWTCSCAAFPTDNHPGDLVEIQYAEILERGFDGQESAACWRLPEPVNSRNTVPAILYAHTKPDIRKLAYPSELSAKEKTHSFVTLRQNLVGVTLRLPHYLADARDVLDWNVLLEEIAHRVDKDSSRMLPTQGLLELLRHEAQIKALLKWVTARSSKSLRERRRVADLASWAEKRAGRRQSCALT